MQLLKILILFLPVFSPILYYFKKNILKMILINSYLISIICLFTMRSLQTPDTNSYEYFFYNINSNDELILRLEPLFKVFIKISFLVLQKFRIFLFLITLLFFYSWIKITKKFVENISIIFGTFFVTYGVYFFGITLRQALAFIVSYYGIKVIIVDGNNKKGLGIIFLSGFIHSSMLLYIPFIFVCKKEIKIKYLRCILFLTFVSAFVSFKNVILLNIMESVLNKLQLLHYKAYLIPNTGVSLNTIYYTVLAFIFIEYKIKMKNDKKYNFFLNFFLIGVLILNFLNFFKGVTRLADIFLIFYSIILSRIFDKVTNRKNKIVYLVFLIINNIILFIVSFKNLFEFYNN